MKDVSSCCWLIWTVVVVVIGWRCQGEEFLLLWHAVVVQRGNRRCREECCPEEAPKVAYSLSIDQFLHMTRAPGRRWWRLRWEKVVNEKQDPNSFANPIFCVSRTFRTLSKCSAAIFHTYRPIVLDHRLIEI